METAHPTPARIPVLAVSDGRIADAMHASMREACTLESSAPDKKMQPDP